MKRLLVPRLDGQLSVLEAGKGPVVLALPGITCPADAWADLAGRLAAHDRRVLVLDQRGRGHSTVTEGGYGLDELADDVLAVLSELELADVVLFGHSMGALVAARAATEAARRRWPGIVRLLLADPPLCRDGRPYPTPLAGYLDLVRRARSGTLTSDEVARRHPAWTSAEPWLTALPSCEEAAITAAHRDFHDGRFLSQWPSLRAELLYGERSDVVTAQDAALLRHANPRSTVRAVPGCGHMIPFERPDELAREVAHAFREVHT
ncbi:alpha/beta fold hydrolase [Streptomyces sp. NPDC052042]|uniref:alpha/beta fold hydrolase n=1 Tax=Streptomyces sp. NPDC052042 TaxID=3365683 RepID=UPI0037CE3D80